MYIVRCSLYQQICVHTYEVLLNLRHGQQRLPLNVGRLIAKFDELARCRGLRALTLGFVNDIPIRMYVARTRLRDKPSALIAATFHGDEVGGTAGALEFFMTAPASIFSRADAAFIPVVNPTGYALGTRENMWLDNPNRGFSIAPHEYDEDEEFDDDTLTIVPNTVPSREGDVLTRHLAMLRSFASCAFITLHEDDRHRGGYLYTADKHIHAPWSSALRKVMVRRCGLVPDGTQTSEKSRTIDGTILSEVDSSFENLLERLGHVNIATTETPRLLPLQLRARTNADLITTTLNYVSAT